MNVNPGGKQAQLRNGWYIKDGKVINQSMIFPSNHPEYLNQPRGMKQVLLEHCLFVPGTHGKCKVKYDPEAISCCCKRILELQPNFKAQKSLVQEVIERHAISASFCRNIIVNSTLLSSFGEQ
jgi:hypothetical protein